MVRELILPLHKVKIFRSCYTVILGDTIAEVWLGHGEGD